jgi:hypothetical protein
MRVYRVDFIHREWARAPRSPFAAASVTFSDPSAAHEKALWFKAQGCHRVTITPLDVPDPVPHTIASYDCKLCGQRIDDGKPCGCGAR